MIIAFQVYIILEVAGELIEETKVYRFPDTYSVKQRIDGIDKSIAEESAAAYGNEITGYEWDFAGIMYETYHHLN